MANTPILNLPVAIGLDGTEYVPLVQGTGSDAVTKRATTGLISQLALASVLPGSIEFLIDGAGGTIAAQTWGYLTVPFNATLTSATLLADQTGSIIVNVWKCTYAAFNPPTTPAAANSITSATPPTISAAKKSQDAALAGWTTDLSEGDVLAFQVPSTPTAITRVTLSLNLTRVVSS